MAEKVLLKDNNQNIIMPITRGELVLDSSGNLALHSNEFLANDNLPGLTSIRFVKVNSIPNSTNTNVVLLKSFSQEVHPVTHADAIIVNVNNTNLSLATVLNNINADINNSKIILDERPTEGNITHGVTSDGIFKELKETVGNIQTLLQQV